MKKFSIRLFAIGAVVLVLAIMLYLTTATASYSEALDVTVRSESEADTLIAQCVVALERQPNTIQAGSLLEMLCELPEQYFNEYMIKDEVGRKYSSYERNKRLAALCIQIIKNHPNDSRSDKACELLRRMPKRYYRQYRIEGRQLVPRYQITPKVKKSRPLRRVMPRQVPRYPARDLEEAERPYL